jgi:hypothetical protein
MNLKLTCVDRPRTAQLAWALPLLILCGCGTAAYHERMEGHLKKLKEIAASQPAVNLSMFYQYIPEDRLPGEQRVNLRVPRFFTIHYPAFNEQSIDQRTGQKYLAPKLWPLGVEIPGYCWSYETTVEEGATEPLKLSDTYVPHGSEIRWTYSFAFGALQVSPEEASEVMQSYLQQLNAELANTTAANPPQIDLQRPELIKEVEIEDQQKYRSRIEQSWEKKLGVVEIYSTYHKQNLVILTGTWIKGMEPATLMPELLPVIASTVKINDEGLTPPPAAE